VLEGGGHPSDFIFDERANGDDDVGGHREGIVQ
jgi:hypothetical protein